MHIYNFPLYPMTSLPPHLVTEKKRTKLNRKKNPNRPFISFDFLRLLLKYKLNLNICETIIYTFHTSKFINLLDRLINYKANKNV